MILSAAQLRRAVQATLQIRLPDALTAVSEHLALPMPNPVTWERLADFTAISERQSPAVVVTTPGITPGTVDHDGDYTATGQVRVFCVARGRDYEETADRVAGYVLALRWSLLADPSLSGVADPRPFGLTKAVTWVGEAYTELAADTNRTVGAGSITVRYDFDTPSVIPPELLHPDRFPPSATSTHVDVTHVNIPEEFL